MAESAIGLYTTELIRRRGPWRNPGPGGVLNARIHRSVHNRRCGAIGHVPPAELEEVFQASMTEEKIKR